MHAATAEITSNQNEGTVLQCGFPALSMLLACNSDVMSCRNCIVIIPLRPSSPFSAARSSASDIALTLATLIRIGIACDMSGISMRFSVFILGLVACRDYDFGLTFVCANPSGR